MDHPRKYWLSVVTKTTWGEFLDAGGGVMGYPEGRWGTVSRFREGDYLLCHVMGISRLIGVLEVVSEPFRDSTLIWADATYPSRVRVRPVVTLTLDTAVPTREVAKGLSFGPAWSGHLRGSPQQWAAQDGEVVVDALRAAAAGTSLPVPIDVTEPERAAEPERDADPSRESEHTEIQWRLLRFGLDLGLDVWVARNDRTRSWNGHSIADLPVLAELPTQFDPRTHRVIELIDVLWLRGNSFVAAFEIECTTSIYSGLLRMSDLVALQPNLSLPLYIVAPDRRRAKVFGEVTRPTFGRLSPPLSTICRYVSIEKLRGKLDDVADHVSELRPRFPRSWAEDCVPDERENGSRRA